MSTIRENVDRVRSRVADAAARAGRDCGEITIVAVTKTFGAEVVDAVVEAGLRDIGENRVQEFLEKSPAVSADCRWHLIGHLQRNKVNKVVGRFALIHSVDSRRLAESLDRASGESGLTSDVLIQVNTSAEETKSGVEPGELSDLAGSVAEMKNLRLRGLMTIGPTSEELSATLACFGLLRRLRDDLKTSQGLVLPELSMGMSGDFEMAIEEGATMVRVGSLITGPRG